MTGTTLAQGDIAIVEANAQINENFTPGFEFVLLKSISAGTTISFTGNSFDSSGAVTSQTGENETLAWTAPSSGLSAGSVVTFTASSGFSGADTPSIGTSTGSIYQAAAGYRITAFQGTLGSNPTLLYTVAFNGINLTGSSGDGYSYPYNTTDTAHPYWNQTGSVLNAAASQLPTTLNNDEVAFSNTQTPNTFEGNEAPASGGYYNGPKIGTAAALFAAITNPANWKTEANYTEAAGVVPAFTASSGPTISSATYNAGTGALVVTGSNLTTNASDFPPSALTITGQAGISYALTGGTVSGNSATGFTVTLTSADQLAVDGLLNKNGTASAGSTTYTIAATSAFDTGGSASNGGVTVTAALTPTISSVAYNAATGVLTLAGTGFENEGSTGGLALGDFTLTGNNGSTVTLSGADTGAITSQTAATITLTSGQKTAVNAIFDANGTSDASNTYNLAATAGWDAGVGTAIGTQAVSVSGYSPTITSAAYDAGTGTLTVTGTGFTDRIDPTKLTIAGDTGGMFTPAASKGYALITPDSATQFTLNVLPEDAATVDALLDKIGTTAKTSGTTYTLTAAAGFDTIGAASSVTIIVSDSGSGPSISASGGTTASILSNQGTAVAIENGSVTVTGHPDVGGIYNGGTFTAAISTHDDSSHDELSIVNAGGITTSGTTAGSTVSYNSTQIGTIVTGATGAPGQALSVALNGSATDSSIAALAKAIGISESGTTSSTLQRTVTFSVSDVYGKQGTTTANVTPAPTIAVTGTTSEALQGGAAITAASGVTISDAESATLSSATVSLGATFQQGDVLAFTNNPATEGNISATYESGTGVLRLSSPGAIATLAQWQAALASVTYQDGGVDTSTGAHPARTLSWTFSDGTNPSNTATTTLTIDRPPTANPDTSSNAIVGVTGNVGANVLSNDTDLDGDALTVTNVASTNTNNPVTTDQGSMTVSGLYGTLTIGTDGQRGPPGFYAYQLDNNAIDNASTGSHPTDTFTYTESDGHGGTAASTLTVKIDRPPTVTLGTSGVTSVPASAGGSAVTLEPSGNGATVSDPDGDAIASVTVTVKGNAQSGDTLSLDPSALTSFTDGSTFTASGNNSSSLTLSASAGTATPAQIAADVATLLDAITFATTSTSTSQRTISFTASDPSGATSTVATETVNFDTGPTITLPTVSLPGLPPLDFKAGATIIFSFTASSAVTVTGTPTLTLRDKSAGNATTTTATYDPSQSSGANFVFTYTVQPGDNFADLEAIGPINLNGGTIKDANGANAVLTPFSIDTTAQIDTIPPTLGTESSASASGTDINAGKVVTFTIATSEPVIVTNGGNGLPTLALNTTPGEVATYSGPTGTAVNSLTFSYTVQPGDNVADLVATAFNPLPTGTTIQDGAHNDASLAAFSTIDTSTKIDTAAPTLTSFVANGASLTNAATVSYTVTFSEAVTGVNASAFALDASGTDTAATIAGVTPVQGSNGASYTVTVNTGAAGHDGTITLDLTGASIKDLAGNGYSGGVFQPQTTYATGNRPASVAIGDVNGDGKPDLVTANNSSGNVSVLLGNGDGTFRTQTAYATGNTPISVAIGDVNGDGRPDLIASNNSNGDVSVLLGNGDGTFKPQTTYSTGTNPVSVVVADVNGDGKPDLVTANNGSNNVSVLLGNGDGTFQTQKTYPLENSPRSVAIADVNGDGKPDLIAVNLASNSVSVLLGNGDGTFKPQQTYPTGNIPYSVAVADVNGDGKPDLVTANNAANSVSVLLGNGDGTFGPQATYATGSSPFAVAIGDVNSDGRPDLVVTNFSSGNVSVLLGNGDGTFQTQTTDATGINPQSVAIGDVNGDGRPDLVTANDFSNNVSVLLNGPQTATGPTFTIDKTAPSVTSVDAPADGIYGSAQDLDVTVHFSEPVTVDTNGGTPSIPITLDTGGTVQAAYAGGTGTNAVTFRYVVAPGNLDKNGITIGSPISLNGGTIEDAARNDAVLTLNSVGSTANVDVDAVAPTVTSIDIAGTSPNNASGEAFTVTFSKAVSGVDASDFVVTETNTVSANALTNAAIVPTGGGNGPSSSWTVTVTGVSGDGNLRLDLTNSGDPIVDAYGNTLVASHTGDQSYTIDHTRPTVLALTDVPAPATSDLKAGTSVTFTLTGSEALTVDPAATLTLGNGATATYASGTGTNAVTFTYTVASGHDTSDLKVTGYSGSITDAAGNALVAAGVTKDTGLQIDTTLPTLGTESSASASGSDINAGKVITFTIATSEPVIVTNGGNGLPTLALNTTPGEVATYSGPTATPVNSLTFSYTVQPGDNVADLKAIAFNALPAGTTIQDGAHNDASLAAFSAIDTATQIDTVAPIAPHLLLANDTSGGQKITSDPTITYTPSAQGDTLLYKADGATTYGTSAPTFATDGSADGQHVVSVEEKDAAGNISGPSSLAFTLDTKAPSAPGAPSLTTAADTGVSDADDITKDTQPDVTGTAEAGSTVTLYDTNGTAVGTGLATGGTYDITPTTKLTDGDHELTVKATDPAGNTSQASPQLKVTVDATAPTVAAVIASGPGINGAAGDIGLGSTITLTVNFDETVFVANGTPTLTLDNGGVATYDSGSGTSALTFKYTVLAGQTSSNLQVAAANPNGATIQDTAGNDANLAGVARPVQAGGAGNPPITLQIDTTAPTLTGLSESPAAGTSGTGSTIKLTLTPSEAVTVTGTPTLTLNDGGTAIYDPAASTPTSLVFDYKVAYGDKTVPSLQVTSLNATNGASITDLAGNGLNASIAGLVQSGPKVQGSDDALFGSITHDVTSPGGNIYALYETILGHAPSPTELEAGVAELDQGKPLEAVAHQLLTSHEYTHQNGRYPKLSDDAFVDLLYENGQHRKATKDELTAWDHQLAGKPLKELLRKVFGWHQIVEPMSRDRVAVEISQLPGTRADLAATFQAGVFVPDTTDSTIARLYYELLGRAPDAGGLAGFEASAQAGTSLKSITNTLLHSSEYAGLHGQQSNAQFVESLFEGAFGRHEGAAGTETYLHELNRGTSRATVALQIAKSPEAVAHLSPDIESGFHLA